MLIIPAPGARRHPISQRAPIALLPAPRGHHNPCAGFSSLSEYLATPGSDGACAICHDPLTTERCPLYAPRLVSELSWSSVGFTTEWRATGSRTEVGR